MCWRDFLGDIIGGASTVLAAFIAVAGAIWAFYRQKEHELIQRRYLDEGLDVVVATAEAALNAYAHNWARCTEVLKAFRDNPSIDIKELDRGFLELPPTRFALSAHYRVERVAGTPVIWQVFQLVLSFAQEGSTICKDEIPTALKLKLTTETINATRAEMVNDALEVLQDLDKRSFRYHVFVGEMQRIISLFEVQRFRFSSLGALKLHPTVLDVTSRLRKAFADKLS